MLVLLLRIRMYCLLYYQYLGGKGSIDVDGYGCNNVDGGNGSILAASGADASGPGLVGNKRPNDNVISDHVTKKTRSASKHSSSAIALMLSSP